MRPRAFMEYLLHETSLYSLLAAGTKDIYILLISRFFRMCSFGGSSLVLGIFLWTAGNKGTQIGTFMSISLLGDAAISYILVLMADRIGRRKVLRIGSILMTFTGTVFAFSKNYYLLLFASMIGVISPGAHEVGPFKAVEESILAQLTTIEARTDIFAWYAVTSTAGMAVGLSATGGITYMLREHLNWNWKDTYPVIFGIYAIVGFVKTVMTFFLSEQCEADYIKGGSQSAAEQEASAPLMTDATRRMSYTKPLGVRTSVRQVRGAMGTRLTPESRAILIRLCVLFALNSFASGMLPVTLMSWYVSYRTRWFLNRIGYAMSAVWVVASIANLFSASVARRLGLVKAMVFTHLPNAIFLGLIPLVATHWWPLLFMLLASSAFGSMDQAPRAAFIAAVFLPSERTTVLGTIGLVQTIASAGGPLLTGYFHDKKLWWAVFTVAAILKISYDVGLLAMFLKTKLPEQSRNAKNVTVADVDVGILLGEQLLPPEDFDHLEDDEIDDEDGAHSALVHGKVQYEEP